jgi:hypothetical protein
MTGAILLIYSISHTFVQSVIPKKLPADMRTKLLGKKYFEFKNQN